MITNTGDEVLKIWNDPHSPLFSFATNTFVVTNPDGEQPRFIGIQVWPKVIARAGNNSSFAVLAPGESFHVPAKVRVQLGRKKCGSFLISRYFCPTRSLLQLCLRTRIVQVRSTQHIPRPGGWRICQHFDR